VDAADLSPSRLARVSALTLDQIAAKIATVERRLAEATTQYDRNVCTQIRDEYKRYAEARAKQLADGQTSAT
jgi:hypothetical protein